MTTVFLRRIVSVVAGLLTAVSPAAGVAQSRGTSEVEILSKDDALRLFTNTKSQWLDEIRNIVASGAAQRVDDAVMPGFILNTPERDILSVRVDYSKGETKPAFIQVSVGYRGQRAARLTDPMLADLVAGAKKQMAPEFDVHGNFERLEGGAVVFFHIMERK